MPEILTQHPIWSNCNRRAFLRGIATLPLLSAAETCTGLACAQAAAGSFPGLIVRKKEPENLEFPFATLADFKTANERFYVRNHFPMPSLNADTWRLRIEGAVDRPLQLTFDDILKMRSRRQIALLECAGNGRAFLTPKAKGVQWELGAVGNAEWTGVPLAAVLDRAGLKNGAVEVILEGADEGEIADEPKPPGKIRFAHSLTLEKARRPEVLLAYRMNDKELPRSHGFPLRVIVAGWYGMASVKWLTRLVVTDRPFGGFFQTLDYSYFERRDGQPSLVPLSEMEVKAEIARPARHEVVPARSTYRIHGAAWAGEPDIKRVEVSTDGGHTWVEAHLIGKPIPYSWQMWEYTWRTPAQPGSVTVMARATDVRGRVQAMTRDPDRRNYKISHVLPSEVEIR